MQKRENEFFRPCGAQHLILMSATTASSAERAAPFFLKRTGASGALGLFRRAGSDATARDSGYALCDLGLLPRASAEGYVEDVLLFDERHARADVAVTRVHRQAVRVLCGADGLAALEAAAPRRLTTSAWLITGGDTARAAEGVAGFLHIITAQLGGDGSGGAGGSGGSA